MFEMLVTGMLWIIGIAVVGGLGLAYWGQWHDTQEDRRKWEKKASKQVQVELDELKRRVDEMQEHIADLYIQSQDGRMRQKKEV